MLHSLPTENMEIWVFCLLRPQLIQISNWYTKTIHLHSQLVMQELWSASFLELFFDNQVCKCWKGSHLDYHSHKTHGEKVELTLTEFGGLLK